jgi:hypothetical protein
MSCGHEQRRAPSKSNRQKAALKREKPAGEPASGAEGLLPHSPYRWEASDQRRTGKRHLLEGGVSCVRDLFLRAPFRIQGQALALPWWLPKVFPPQTRTCQRWTFPVVSELPIERLMQATQAWGRASSPPSKQISPGSSIGRKLCAAKAHIGQGIIREKRRPRRIDSGERTELNNDSCVRNGNRILTGAQGVESQGQMRGDRFKNGARSHSSHGD